LKPNAVGLDGAGKVCAASRCLARPTTKAGSGPGEEETPSGQLGACPRVRLTTLAVRDIPYTLLTPSACRETYPGMERLRQVR